MESTKKALLVSILARAWAAGIGFLVVPLYVRFLGIEAYGLVGFFASIQAVTTFLDLGLGATLIRELARIAGKSDRLPDGRDTTRTFEIVYLLIAALIGAVLVLLAPLFANHWVKVDTLSIDEVSRALVLAGIALACQWPAGLYGSGMAGLHRQTELGLATGTFATLRVLVTLFALWLSPNLTSFFWAQIVGALLQSWGMRVLLWRGLKLRGHTPRLSRRIIQSSIGFAGGMTGITITTIVLTQMDKLILSHTLALADFGVYVLSGTLAFGLYVLIGPVFSVMYPRFASLLSSNEGTAIAPLYHLSSQAMAALIMPLAAVMAFFAHDVLFIWTHDAALSNRGAWVLALLVLGNACNGVMNVPYALQLAAGWASLSLWINVGAIALFAPATWWCAMHFGPVGGAAVWCALNATSIFITPQFIHRRLLVREKIEWFMRDVILPATVSGTVACALAFADSYSSLSRIQMVLKLACYWLLTALLTTAVLPHVRVRLRDATESLLNRLQGH